LFILTGDIQFHSYVSTDSFLVVFVFEFSLQNVTDFLILDFMKFPVG